MVIVKARVMSANTRIGFRWRKSVGAIRGRRLADM